MARREGVPVSRRFDFFAARFPPPEHFKRVLPCFLPLSLLLSKRKADKQRQARDTHLPRMRWKPKQGSQTFWQVPLGGNLALLLRL